jgi:TPR repeat protein
VCRAAELGDAFAQAEMAWKNVHGEGFRWAEKSAGQGERDGFFMLGVCCRGGLGCEQDVKRAKESFLVSAELGHVCAMVRLGELLEKDDPQRLMWFGRAAANGDLLSS